VPAFAINASAILPSRCAFLLLFQKYQKIPKVEVPICHPYQFTVSGSSKLVVMRFKNAATSLSRFSF
jgi:hypothetical protein